MVPAWDKNPAPVPAQMLALQEQRQFHGVFQRAAGVRRHEIRDEILLFPDLFRAAEEFPLERKIGLNVRLAHAIQHGGGTMLRSHLQLAADMVGHKLMQEGFVLVEHEVVEADAGADEHALHARQRADFAQEIQIPAVVHLQRRARRRRQAFFSGQRPCVFCFWQEGWRKFAVGPPTSCM